MSFISITFALFVACALAVYYIFPKKIRWVVLLVASYVFYTWTGFDNIAYILITTENKTYLFGTRDSAETEALYEVLTQH